jgi:hypothetical protein
MASPQKIRAHLGSGQKFRFITEVMRIILDRINRMVQDEQDYPEKSC